MIFASHDKMIFVVRKKGIRLHSIDMMEISLIGQVNVRQDVYVIINFHVNAERERDRDALEIQNTCARRLVHGLHRTETQINVLHHFTLQMIGIVFCHTRYVTR